MKVDKRLFRALAHHFWKVDKVSHRVFSENNSPLKEIVATPRRDDISKKKWIEILQNLQEEDTEWRALWLLPDEILYRCEDFDWVPLLEIWELLVMPHFYYSGNISQAHGIKLAG
ncbi:hypothetical protein Goklo_003015 [Gossypium klotzschianum]|uniref:Uncharacterized protein n=1 Tax=Gossypium klotzschianum TaxID=34286 RepID=A0A7J8VVH4_9ROSI|nr:hypothetical protein [Gossypium klotzschianum]